MTRLAEAPVIRRSRALLACLVAGFSTLIDSSLLGIATPALRQSLSTSTAETQWILASYSLTFGLALVPAGRLGDMYGRRTLFLGGIALFGVMSLVGGLAAAPAQIVAARFLQGVGAGAVSAQVLGVIQDLFTGPARAKALGAYGVSGGLAGLLGPLIGAYLVAVTDIDIGWRLALLVNVPFAALAFVLGVKFLPAHRIRSKSVSFDPFGLLLLGAATVLVTMPFVWADGPSILLSAAAAICLVGFVLWERRYARLGCTPVLLPALARSGEYLRGTLVAAFWFGAALAQATVLTLYIIGGLGESALLAAVILLPRSVGFMAASAISWRLLDRFGRGVVSAGIGSQLVGTLAIAFVAIPLDRPGFLWTLAGIELLMGLAHGVSEAPNRALTLSSVAASSAGTAAGFLQLSQRLTATVAIAAATGIYLAANTGRESISAAAVLGLVLTAGMLGLSLTISIVEQRAAHRRTSSPVSRKFSAK